jgi:hypothetical protein
LIPELLENAICPLPFVLLFSLTVPFSLPILHPKKRKFLSK